uniref:Uncharacterized protein n=1 Tax=Lactuca sativa TaxID=4236 RepID=A0A9R1XKF4_LACSA|nr:hypothetical protein LSAT_V11C300149550 [Lactuca sativa]
MQNPELNTYDPLTLKYHKVQWNMKNESRLHRRHLTPATSHTRSAPPSVSTKHIIDPLEVHLFCRLYPSPLLSPPLLPSVNTSSPNPILLPRSTIIWSSSLQPISGSLSTISFDS